MTPGGVRIGTPAMTSRGLKEADFERIAELLHQVVVLCKEVQAGSGKMLKAFERCVGSFSLVCVSSSCVLSPQRAGGSPTCG